MTTETAQPITRAAARTATITPDTRITNNEGAWAELRFDPTGGYRPGYGPTGIWYAVVWSPDFRGEATPDPVANSTGRAKAERAIRRWLAGRPFTAEQCAAFDAAHCIG
jgi:hypothetical protein